MRPRLLWFAALVSLAASVHAQAPSQTEEHGALLAEIRDLRRAIAVLQEDAQKLMEQSAGTKQQLDALNEQVRSLEASFSSLTALPFVAGPPPSTDAVGVARTVVFAPRIAADSARSREAVFLSLRRVESSAISKIADLELSRDELSIDLPLDQSGALYIVDWSTAEGHSYALQLRDGSGGPDAGGPPAATVQIKPQQNRGRIIFVGYRVD